MGIYNYLAASEQCSKCGNLVYFPEIQFKYGLCRSEKYLVGFKVDQDINDVTSSASKNLGRIVVDGIGKCPECFQWNNFALELIDSLIVGVRQATRTKLRFSISATITLLATNGRSGPIRSGYQCPMKINEEHWECLLMFAGPNISPGETRSGVIIQFLSPEAVSQRLTDNSTFYLTEGKIIGSGNVDVCHHP